jgi:hypothetical protein
LFNTGRLQHSVFDFRRVHQNVLARFAAARR